MVRIVTIIEKPHLATYKPDRYMHRSCTICRYKIIIEDDETTEGLLVASVLDEEGIEYFNAEDYYNKREANDYRTDGDFFYPFSHRVKMWDVEEFIQGKMEDGWEPEKARRFVLSDIAESGINCDDDVREMIEANIRTSLEP